MPAAGTTGATLVRAARGADAEAVAALFLQLGYQAGADDVRQRLDARGGRFASMLVAEHGGRVAGVIVVNLIEPMHVPGRWAMVSALVVEASVRGAGIGALLLAEAERRARQEGCSRVELSSSEGRTGAHAFYLRQGFEEVRKRFVKRLEGMPVPAGRAEPDIRSGDTGS